MAEEGERVEEDSGWVGTMERRREATRSPLEKVESGSSMEKMEWIGAWGSTSTAGGSHVPGRDDEKESVPLTLATATMMARDAPDTGNTPPEMSRMAIKSARTASLSPEGETGCIAWRWAESRLRDGTANPAHSIRGQRNRVRDDDDDDDDEDQDEEDGPSGDPDVLYMARIPASTADGSGTVSSLDVVVVVVVGSWASNT